jgi:hypothetical protein
MILTNKLYEIMKWITLILLPAISMLYLALSEVWGLPYADQIVGTIAAVDLFLGMVLGISSYTYKTNNPLYYVNLTKLVGEVERSWILSTRMYDILTWVAQILLPALATLYMALSTVWGFPYGEQIVATIMAIDTFLGMLLGFSTAQFHKKAAQVCVDSPEARLEEAVG